MYKMASNMILSKKKKWYKLLSFKYIFNYKGTLFKLTLLVGYLPLIVIKRKYQQRMDD